MRLRLLVPCFASCGVSFVAAQPDGKQQAGEPLETLPPIFAPRASSNNASSKSAPRPVPSTPARRVLSPEMSAKLSAVATRAAESASTPPPTVAAPTAPPENSPAAVQLKPYVVREDRMREFKEREMLTLKGKLALAHRRHPTALTNAAALQMLEEDFTRERRQEMADLLSLLDVAGGAKAARDVERKVETSTRPSGFSPQFGEPFRPPK